MPSPTFHGGQAVSNHSHEVQSHVPGFTPIYGQLSFGSHNLQATQTAVLGTHNLSQSSRNSANFNFQAKSGVAQSGTNTPTLLQQQHLNQHQYNQTIKSLENVLENLELNNAISPTRKTSHNFSAKLNYSDSDRQSKSINAYGKGGNSPKLLPENVGIPYPHEEIVHRLSTTDPYKMHREVKAPKLPTEQEDIHLNSILNTPELPPKVHLGKKSPVFARGSGETLFRFDPQRLHRVNNASQDGNS